MAFISAHYRAPLEFSEESIAEAQEKLERLKQSTRLASDGPSPQGLGSYLTRFKESLYEDFNTPKALSELFGWVREANRLGEAGGQDLAMMLKYLGLESLTEESEPPDAVKAIFAERQQARADGDYQLSDQLRDQLKESGWQIDDVPTGSRLRPLID